MTRTPPRRRSALRLSGRLRLLLGALLALLAAQSGGRSTVAMAQSAVACQPGDNAIACENRQTDGVALPAAWDVSGSGDPDIQGFATDISVDQGQTVHFKISSVAPYSITIYRLGYYGGAGARKVGAIADPGSPLPADDQRTRLGCLSETATGLVDCGNWAESASWNVPLAAASGVYIARLVRTDTGGASHIVFVVRDDDGGSQILFQTSDTTWQAYNQYGGNSLYAGGPGTNPNRAYKVSYNRPFTTRGYAPEDWLFNAEYPMIRWLEANGYDVSYTTGVDSDRRGAEILEHKAFLSVGRDEYWSAQQRSNVEAARGAGVHLAFLSGNEMFWKTRWESDISTDTDPVTPGLQGAPYRTLVSYKETHANGKIDPLPTVWTGTWRDAHWSDQKNSWCGQTRERADRTALHRQRSGDLRHERAVRGRTAAPLAQHGGGGAQSGADGHAGERHAWLRMGRGRR